MFWLNSSESVLCRAAQIRGGSMLTHIEHRMRKWKDLIASDQPPVFRGDSQST